MKGCLCGLVLAIFPQQAVALPARQVTVSASPSSVTLGGSGPQEVKILVLVRDGAKAATDADLVLHATAGEVREVKEVGPGQFVAVLAPPEERFPQLAVVTAADISLVAFGAPPEIGTAVVAFSAAITLKGRAEPGVHMIVSIGAQRFGPVLAAMNGDFTLPVVVPPGENWGQGIATDRLGNTSRSRINLYLPEVQRVHGFVFPAELVADGLDAGWVFVTTVSASGAPEEAAIKLEASRGDVGAARRLGVGLHRFDYRAPRGIGDGADLLGVRSERARAHEETKVSLMQVSLVAGAPVRLEVAVAPSPVPADGVTAAAVIVKARDAQGSPAQGHGVELQAGDKDLVVSEMEPGAFTAQVAPQTRVGKTELRATLTPRTAVCGRGRLVEAGDGLRVVDARGVGCVGHFKVVAAGDRVLWDGELKRAGSLGFSLAELGQQHVEVDGGLPRRVAGVGTAVKIAEQVKASGEVVWRLPSAVDLKIHELSRKKGEIRLRVDALGAADVRNRLQVVATSGVVAILDAQNESVEVSVKGAATPFDVVATDSKTGVAAWLRVE